MGASDELSYKPPPEFEEVKKDALVNLNLTDSTELWLIQWPLNQHPDLDGQEISLKIHNDGHMGSFEDSSGKSFDVVSCRGQDPEAMVFLSSESETKIVGKISRRVSLIHYPEPSELKQNNTNLIQIRSSSTSLTNSSRRFATSSRSNRPQSQRSGSGVTHSNRSSKTRSTLSEAGEPSQSTKRKQIDSPVRSTDQSVQDSGRGHSALTLSGSSDQSEVRKSKKKRKIDG